MRPGATDSGAHVGGASVGPGIATEGEAIVGGLSVGVPGAATAAAGNTAPCCVPARNCSARAIS
jgi:hypothetical protein